MDSNLPSTFIQGFHDNEAVKKIKYVPLGETGMMVSILGLGGGQFGLSYNTPEEKDTHDAIKAAVKSGINYIDTAPYYGEGTSEIVLGKALKDLPRESYYVATKVGRYSSDYKSMFDFSYNKTLESVDVSLKKLGVDYIDLIQVHDLEFAPSKDIILNETLPALEKVKQSGKAKFIGITGYPIDDLKYIVEKSTVKIDCVLSYSRYTLFDDSLLEYLDFFKEKKVGVIHAAALGMGLLTSCRPLPKWHPVILPILCACDQALLYTQERGVDIAKLALHYSMAQKGIDIHLTGMPNIKDLNKNLETIQGKLSKHEEKVLEEIMEKFFKPLETKHWEKFEVDKYWKYIFDLQKPEFK